MDFSHLFYDTLDLDSEIRAKIIQLAKLHNVYISVALIELTSEQLLKLSEDLLSYVEKLTSVRSKKREVIEKIEKSIKSINEGRSSLNLPPHPAVKSFTDSSRGQKKALKESRVFSDSSFPKFVPKQNSKNSLQVPRPKSRPKSPEFLSDDEKSSLLESRADKFLLNKTFSKWRVSASDQYERLGPWSRRGQIYCSDEEDRYSHI